MSGTPDRSEGGSIYLQLSQRQVRAVLVAAATDGPTRLSGLLGHHLPGTAEVDQLLRVSENSQLRFSLGLLKGLLLLACVPLDGTLIGVGEVARRLDLNASTAHRYISTLLAAGLLERDDCTRRYRLSRKYTISDR
jgi:hypothetical protein